MANAVSVLDWELVTSGRSNAIVRQSPDGRSFAETASTLAGIGGGREGIIGILSAAQYADASRCPQTSNDWL